MPFSFPPIKKESEINNIFLLICILFPFLTFCL
nr:MAG TPA: periplasmic nitrate reductase [Caudoviricetes sp.]